MFNIVLILGILAAFLMIVIVLIQNPKGGGLASNFSSSTQIFGVKRTNDGVEKGTWIAAILILAVSLMSSTYNGSTSSEQGGVPSNSDVETMNNAPTPKNTAVPMNNLPAENNTGNGAGDAQTPAAGSEATPSAETE